MMKLSVGRQERFSRTLANLLLLALVLYLAVELAKLTWLVAWNDRPVPEIFGQTAAGAEVRSRVSGAPIAGYEFFGRPDNQKGVADVVRRSAPETGLRLRLEGVLVGQRPEDSGAIVAGSNGETEYYRVGDQLPGNAELAEVEAGRILLRRGGRYESLAFEEQIETGALVAEEPVQTAESPDTYLEDARARLDSEGVAALATYGLQPAEDRSGYVYDGSNAMLNAVNLRPGDIITSVNGQPLGDIEQDKQLLDSWRSQPQLDIEIERDGTLLTVSYAIPEQWR
ncbi:MULTISPECIES: type II secretion system protein N [Marinobacter]|jgi:general secretion pathway protein C|uniref:General secretion pathway protein GspC n=1 Tax=Marinobacter nauticus TaxID=2743 RepID=A0A368V9M0_MARNT|nr:MULTISPECIES: type II secretion system protein N [Marinobacter]RBP77071.1 type II secretion system protein C (GspC) [Marinobacter nauticus]RCW37917.1 type II secretion system protein C (GspC) [Marinobacter nauticus]TPW23567.1 general secretion pathway protein GspC [Marinobacter nauticus]CCG94752.1 putative General Secretion Pathway protein GspC [Marinobacter nauticus ATCC 49840]HAC29068.1 general secretion pathway protein GspC [Marinobacter nauticus]|tara:strand:+ start:725 stop:1573 length:849 start_codon:yes stop_codon:yes gene_type:complete